MLFLSFLALASVVWKTSSQSSGPQQIRIAATTSSSSLVFKWTTPEKCNNDSSVFYGLSSSTIDNSIKGDCIVFEYGNSEGLHYIHTVTLTDLKELTTYYYYVYSSNIESDIFFVKTLSDSPSWVPNIIIFGDLGHKGGELEHKLFTALPAIINEVEKGTVDLVIHNGDFAYNLDSKNGTRGDEFLRNIQNVSAYVPYMTTVGNHEWHYNASNYRNRFSMPRSTINDGFDMWYSLDIGQAHYIFFSTETLFFRPQDNQNQFDWLQNDLENANNNRDTRPWIITLGHRPMYCSNKDHDCLTPTSAGEAVRAYVEDLFFDYGVDIQIWAHEHSYERTWPVYNFTVPQENYINPKAPVHLITGAAGCNEDNGLCLNPIYRSGGNWSAFRTSGKFHPYSYGHLRIYNSSLVYWDQVNAQQNEVYDQIYIQQDVHGPFQPL